uniref:hypothetical protein n=1 Tax=Altererythrobacter segetis TaxID=1104773 RepID=UPI0014094F3B|nr:hypothetical protein [Altererythrobacter segetis]
MKEKLAGAAMLVALLASGCSVKQPEPRRPKSYVVGLGEIMGQNQMRHAKLWFAGSAQNWPLARYELDELREGFDDVKSFHPSVDNTATAPLVDEYVGGPLGDLDKAIADKNQEEFTAAFDGLSAGCNACHKDLDFGFNVIKRPTAPPFTNQEFAPVKPG